MPHKPHSRQHFLAARCASAASTGAAAVTLMHSCFIFSGAKAQPLLDLTEETWSKASLSAARSSLAATSLPNDGVAMFAGGYGGATFNVVDVFNARTGVWTTAALSVARFFLAATSLPNDGVAMFAGGTGASCS
jgi:hypothetical protein